MIAIVIGLLLPSAAHAVECQPKPTDQRGHWSWRNIDGKRCWYRGRPGLAKSRLSWKTAGPVDAKPKPATDKPATDVRLEARAEAETGNPPRTFEERWPFHPSGPRPSSAQ